MREFIEHGRPSVVSVADLALDLSPTADHVLRVIEQLADANGRLVLDHDTVDLLASHNGLSRREMYAVLESIEEAGALRYLGLDLRGGWA